MPDRIPVFQPKVGVTDTPTVNANLPGVVDVGQEIASVGRSLLAIAEPHAKARAIHLAEEEAAALNLSKGEDGVYTRAPAPRTGSGLAYREKFNQIIQQREVSLYDADHQQKLNELQAKHRLDPQGFVAAAQAFGEGQLEKMNPDVRAQVETNYTREMVQRMNRVASDTTMAEVHSAIDAAQTTLALYDDQNEKLADSTDPDAIKQIEASIPKAVEQLRILKEAGVINDSGVDARMGQVALQTKNYIERAQGFVAIGRLGANLSPDKIDDDALFLLSNVFDGAILDPETKFFGMSSEEIQATIPRNQWNQAGQLINREMSRRAELAREAAANARSAAEIDAATQSAEAVRTAIANQNYNPESGESLAQQEYAEQELSKFGSIGEQMLTSEGQARIKGYTADHGTAPQHLKEWIESNSNGAQLPSIASFMVPMKEVVSKNGTQTGNNFWRKLDKDTRARLEIYWAGKKTGASDATLVTQIDQVARDQAVTTEKLGDLYNTRTQTYADLKHRTVQQAFGLKSPAHAQQLTVIEQDFDAQVAYFNNFYSPQKSMELATEAMGRLYVASPVFSIGVGPREAVPAGVSMADYDKSILPGVPVEKRGGATFSNGRVKLQPIEYDPDGGALGIWYAHVYNPSGQIVHSQRINMQQRMGAVMVSKVAAEKQRQQQLIREAEVRHQKKAKGIDVDQPTPFQQSAM